jgi:hypothetical protein
MAFQYWNTTLPTTYLTAAAYDAVGSTPLSKLLHKKMDCKYDKWI